MLKPEIQSGVMKGLVAGEPQEQARAEGRDVRSMLVAKKNSPERDMKGKGRRSEMSPVVELRKNRNIRQEKQSVIARWLPLF